MQSNADEFSANTGRTMTDDELRRIRELRAEPFVKWAAVAQHCVGVGVRAEGLSRRSRKTGRGA
jgi:hypothetical protein